MRPKPSSCSRPSCQTTAIIEVASGAMVARRQRVYKSSRIKVIVNVKMAKSTIAPIPSSRSPTILGKPMICTVILSFS